MTPLLFLAAFCQPSQVHADSFDRMEMKKLAELHRDLESLRAQWQAVPRPGPYREHRANLHVHSHWSHDSRGTIAEIIEAAKKVGTTVLMFNEHPAEHYDFFKEGHQGTSDGILLIPGAETNGFLSYPTMSLQGLKLGSPQEFTDLVCGRGGMMFVSHLEERMDWKLQGITGVEIYNTHADFKDETRLMDSLRKPLWIVQAAGMVRKYPQESFSSLQDYPKDYLARWDELCAIAPHTGVSANDAHQNVGMIAKWAADNVAKIEDPLGKPITELPLATIPSSILSREGKKEGDELFRLVFDSYVCSLRHVGTHLLLTEFSEKGVRGALQEGRAFVAFDWLADSTGSDFVVLHGEQRIDMGSQHRFENGMKFNAQAPLPVHWRLMSNGKPIHESSGRTFSHELNQAGIYRIEAWVEAAQERRLWILSNPIYLTE